MATVALLSAIVLGLVMVFSQTQRAFTTSMSQVDVLETGRAVMDMLTRELAEMAPSQAPFTTNYMAVVDVDSFSKPLLQDLPVTDYQRTNIVQRFYFLSRQNKDWIGTGYYVLPAYENAGVGTLYKYSVTTRQTPLTNLYGSFLDALRRGLISNRIAEGVVHLRLLAYDVNGRQITQTNILQTTNTIREWNLYIPDQTDCVFWSNAVPATVELELGILESQALERFKALGNANAAMQRQYLSNHAAQVHLFRQRIPIRNVDPYVYVTNETKIF